MPINVQKNSDPLPRIADLFLGVFADGKFARRKLRGDGLWPLGVCAY
jgi:hypothetical protein